MPPPSMPVARRVKASGSAVSPVVLTLLAAARAPDTAPVAASTLACAMSTRYSPPSASVTSRSPAGHGTTVPLRQGGLAGPAVAGSRRPPARAVPAMTLPAAITFAW